MTDVRIDVILEIKSGREPSPAGVQRVGSPV